MYKIDRFSLSISKSVESPNKKITMNIFEIEVAQEQIQKVDIIYPLFSARLLHKTMANR